MARINGINHTIERATPTQNKTGYDRKYSENYICDNFPNIHAVVCWPMVDTVEDVLADFEKMPIKRKLKIIEPSKTTLKAWQRN